LHLAIDEHHHVLACELTTPEVGDPSDIAILSSVMAYDSETVSRAVLAHQPDAKIVSLPCSFITLLHTQMKRPS